MLAEQRLVPSDVRVFHGGSRTLGRTPEEALAALGVGGVVTRLELALAHDPIARARVGEEGLDLVVTPVAGPTATVRLVDRR